MFVTRQPAAGDEHSGWCLVDKMSGSGGGGDGAAVIIAGLTALLGKQVFVIFNVS